MIDDEAANPVENQCVTAAAPAIWGIYSPNNLQSAFDGQSLAGDWRLTVSDNRAANTGTLVQWCLSVDGS
jgi:subtilisin-like proprotein convertase family protein